MWRELVKAASEPYDFFPPATKQDVSQASRALKVKFPEALSDLLFETNGVQGELGRHLVWSSEQILKENLKFRGDPHFKKLYMPFDNLLFFGDAGNGDQFAYSICDGIIRKSDIFVWNHENDSRTWIAPSLQRYLEWWSTGKINI